VFKSVNTAASIMPDVVKVSYIFFSLDILDHFACYTHLQNCSEPDQFLYFDLCVRACFYRI
jgi:hypothetical protein